MISCDQKPTVSVEEKVGLYNDVLDQIIMNKYYHHCLIPDENIDRMVNALHHGTIDSLTYSRIEDSLTTVRKNRLPKCVLDFTDDFQIYAKSRELNDIKFSITEALKDTFIISNFGGVSINAIVDTLSQPSALKATDLAVNYLEIVPYLKRKKRLYGEGMGVMGLSKIYFNRDLDKAILYYEFNCGPKCGTGEVVFIAKTGLRWEVKSYKRVWDS